MSLVTITRTFGIDAGHRVTRHESQCRNVHGHRYQIEVTVSAPSLDEVGRVLDFGRVKEVVGGWLLSQLDHGYLAAPWDEMAALLAAQGFKLYLMPEVEPTAENLALHLLQVFQGLLGEPYRVLKVRVYETPNCWADAS